MAVSALVRELQMWTGLKNIVHFLFQECLVTLSFTNPVENVLKITLLQLHEAKEEETKEETKKDKEQEEKEGTEEKGEKENNEKGVKVKIEKDEKEVKKEDEKEVKGKKAEEDEKEVKGKKADEEKGGKRGKEKVIRTSSLFDKKPGRQVNNKCDSRAFEATAEVRHHSLYTVHDTRTAQYITYVSSDRLTAHARARTFVSKNFFPALLSSFFPAHFL